MSTALECLRQLNIINEEISIPRILYGVVLTLISVVSIVMNTLILLIIFSTDAMDRLFRFYLLSATLGGLIEVVPILSALTPAILFNVHLNDPTNVIISTTDTLGYLTLMMTTTAIATDRFVFFMLPKVHRLLSRTDVILPCFAALPLMIAVLIISHMTLIGCYKRTDPFVLAFTYSCSSCSYYGPLLYFAGYVFPVVNVVFYLFIFWRIVALRQELRSITGQCFSANSVRAQELPLVIHFSLICVIQFGSSSLFYLLPPLTCGTPISFYVSMVFSAMNTMINPTVIFVFQKRIRKAFLGMFRRSSPVEN